MGAQVATSERQARFLQLIAAEPATLFDFRNQLGNQSGTQIGTHLCNPAVLAEGADPAIGVVEELAAFRSLKRVSS